LFSYIISFSTIEGVIRMGLSSHLLYDRAGLFMHLHIVKNGESENINRDFSHWNWQNYDGKGWKSIILQQPEKPRKKVF